MHTRTLLVAIAMTSVVLLSAPRPALADFVRGDANGDADIDIADPIHVLAYLFSGGLIGCSDAADANDDGMLDLGDPIRILAVLFASAPPISSPFPTCGLDSTADALACALPPSSCVVAVPGLTYSGTNAQGCDEYTLDVDPSVVLIRIPGGMFEIGQVGMAVAEPVHMVTLSPYLIAKAEITNAQYRLYCDSTGALYPLPPCCGMPVDHFTNPVYDHHPVVMVSWDDLTAPGGYLDWAGLLLPTEAQWEFAARGTDGRPYPWGFELPDDDGIFRSNGCWAFQCTASDGWTYTSPVADAQFAAHPGPFGTLGQAGNAWEWVSDVAGPYAAAPVTDPTGPAGTGQFVYRGGSWYDASPILHSANRGGLDPWQRFWNLGFRVAHSIP